MPANDHYVESASLSDAWIGAMRLLIDHREVVPLIVSTTGFENDLPVEDLRIREAIDRELLRGGQQSCHTVANTIFPDSLWNPSHPRSELFERYKRIFPKLVHANGQNRFGTYFQRLTSGGPTANENQLDFALETFSGRSGVRRSTLQLAVFDPARDHSAAARRGFPCLQHVTFSPSSEGLSINGFYAMQYMMERAYGNYLGLCRLGRFVAHELERPLVRMTCYTGIAVRDINVRELHHLLAVM
jgi:hypothetical protein